LASISVLTKIHSAVANTTRQVRKHIGSMLQLPIGPVWRFHTVQRKLFKVTTRTLITREHSLPLTIRLLNATCRTTHHELLQQKKILNVNAHFPAGTAWFIGSSELVYNMLKWT